MMKKSNEISKVIKRIKNDIEFLESNLKLGRPPKDYSELEEAFKDGMSIEQAMKKFNVSRSTAYKLFRQSGNYL